MKEVFLVTMLYDFYGQLLTEKQRSAIELYHLEDLSLNEIASMWDCSRQGVRDLIKRTENILNDYEKKLGLVKKYIRNKKNLDDCLDKLDNILHKHNLDNSEEFVDIRKKLSDILE